MATNVNQLKPLFFQLISIKVSYFLKFDYCFYRLRFETLEVFNEKIYQVTFV